MSLFDLSKALVSAEPSAPAAINNQWITDMVISEKRFGNVAAAIGSIQKNAVINYWTDNHFSNHELLYYLLSQAGPAKVYIACWTISEKVGRDINAMIDQGLITQMWGVLDNTSRSRHPADFHYSKNLFNRLTMDDIHAKTCVIENDDWLISFFGSANFTTNHRIERGAVCTVQYIAQNDKQQITNLMQQGERVIWN